MTKENKYAAIAETIIAAFMCGNQASSLIDYKEYEILESNIAQALEKAFRSGKVSAAVDCSFHEEQAIKDDRKRARINLPSEVDCCKYLRSKTGYPSIGEIATQALLYDWLKSVAKIEWDE